MGIRSDCIEFPVFRNVMLNQENSMRMVQTVEANSLPWLQLAAEGEHLFGPVVNEPG